MSDVVCESKVKKHESTCTWTIHDWETTREWTRDMKLTSEVFSSETNDGTKWCLEIHPMGATEKVMQSNYYGETRRTRINYVSVYLRLVSVKEGSVAKAKFVLYGIDEKNKKVTLVTMNPETANIDTNPRIGMKNAIVRDRLSSNLFTVNGNNTGGDRVVLDDKLKLMCQVIEYTYVADNLAHRRIIVPEYQNVDDYSYFFETKIFSDVKIIAKENIEFKAHKLILAHRSPVFAAMFKVKQECNNSIEIMDTEPKVLEETLRFIYTGKVGDIDEMAEDFLAVAEKYALERLKITCEEKLYATLNVKNATDIFAIADRHSCEQLKTLTSNFINEHLKDVIQTVGYSSLIKTHPDFAEKLLRDVFSQENCHENRHSKVQHSK